MNRPQILVLIGAVSIIVLMCVYPPMGTWQVSSADQSGAVSTGKTIDFTKLFMRISLVVLVSAILILLLKHGHPYINPDYQKGYEQGKKSGYIEGFERGHVEGIHKVTHNQASSDSHHSFPPVSPA